MVTPPSRTAQSRMRFVGIALMALTLAAEPASARQWSAVCSNLSGVRVDDQGTVPAFVQRCHNGCLLGVQLEHGYAKSGADPSSFPRL